MDSDRSAVSTSLRRADGRYPASESELDTRCRLPKLFDAVSHDWLIRFLRHRIGDERILRLIRKCLRREYSKKGSSRKARRVRLRARQRRPAGQCLLALRVRPLGAAVAETPRPRDMIVVRFADDSVLGFEYEADAKRFLADMRARSEVFSLTLHPEKTRIIRFGRYAALNRRNVGR